MSGALCFNLRSDGIWDKLITDGWVTAAGTSADWRKQEIGFKPPDGRRFSMLWDTGASSSAISTRVIKACGLRPVGTAQISDYRNTWNSETYLVDLALPNTLIIERVPVARVDVGHADVVIGMDIITLGDFAITNLGGKTLFSFRYPSQRQIDFVAENNAPFRH